MHVDEFNEEYTAPIEMACGFIYTCPRCKLFCNPEVSVANYPNLVKYIDENRFVNKVKNLKIFLFFYFLGKI